MFFWKLLTPSEKMDDLRPSRFVPFRGYADAANQHPLEQMVGETWQLRCLKKKSHWWVILNNPKQGLTGVYRYTIYSQ